MRQIGKGFAGAFKLFSTLNLPQLTKTAYKNQESKLLKVIQEVAEESMIKAATEIEEKQQNLSSDIVKCGISVDGTCQRRGYTSMNGCVAAISIDTGHVQKRVGSRLRKLKTKTKGLSGKGKLTDNFIDRLQNYYGIAVRSNVGNLTAMQQNVIAALYHCASSDKKPMHGQCPIGKESWCYFQRGVANGTKCSTKYAGLSNDVLNKIKPVYLELCDKQILTARGLLTTDHVILNHGQMTWMTPELAPLSPNYHTNGRTFELSTDLTCIAALHGGSLVILGSNS
ncbi:uncharacterized protein TNCV_4347191 [Trichonephila clavipes]|nr:uncharacterized protein TNCV_4347191 [Trichonephila clavipes]